MDTLGEFSCSLVCNGAKGAKLHACEENRCGCCSLHGYFIRDNDTKLPKGAVWNSTPEAFQKLMPDLDLDDSIAHKLYVKDGQKLSGNRMYPVTMLKKKNGIPVLKFPLIWHQQIMFEQMEL